MLWRDSIDLCLTVSQFLFTSLIAFRATVMCANISVESPPSPKAAPPLLLPVLVVPPLPFMPQTKYCLKRKLPQTKITVCYGKIDNNLLTFITFQQHNRNHFFFTFYKRSTTRLSLNQQKLGQILRIYVSENQSFRLVRKKLKFSHLLLIKLDLKNGDFAIPDCSTKSVK